MSTYQTAHATRSSWHPKQDRRLVPPEAAPMKTPMDILIFFGKKLQPSPGPGYSSRGGRPCLEHPRPRLHLKSLEGTPQGGIPSVGMHSYAGDIIWSSDKQPLKFRYHNKHSADFSHDIIHKLLQFIPSLIIWKLLRIPNPYI